MANKTSTLKIGIFITIGIAILVVAIFLLGDKNAMFKSTFDIKAYFKDIQGLRSGATVRLSGIDVGSVKNIRIVPDTTGRIQVTMSVVKDIQRFVKTDTRASIETEGLVGNKVVVLQIGSSNAEEVTNGGTIQAKEPLGFSAILAETQGIMEYTKDMTKNLADIIGRVNRGEGTIGKLLKDEKLYNDAQALTKQADQSLQSITTQASALTNLFNELGEGVKHVIGNVDSVVSRVDIIVAGIQKGNGILGQMTVNGTKFDSTFNNTLSNIEKTSYDARLSASRLAENMEALKHNWLFKSYFENRGYWDNAGYEDDINSKIKELNQKIKMLDDRINTLQKLEPQQK
ncbi:MAG: MlaD family protein [Ignavibacteriaceae bacterium]|nr:MlaD family protein [Ignavibacteriaceae bacterium]